MAMQQARNRGNHMANKKGGSEGNGHDDQDEEEEEEGEDEDDYGDEEDEDDEELNEQAAARMMQMMDEQEKLYLHQQMLEREYLKASTASVLAKPNHALNNKPTAAAATLAEETKMNAIGGMMMPIPPGLIQDENGEE